MSAWLARLDQAVRVQTRYWFAAVARAVKIVRERTRTTAHRVAARSSRRWRHLQHESGRAFDHRTQRSRRLLKIGTERTVNVKAAATNLTRKAGRRVWGLRRPFVRGARQVGRLNEQFQSHREEWAIEREIEAAVAGDEPILFGPWTSEVGYEALYWVAFVRWVKTQYRLKTDRLTVMSRGGVGSWYADVTPRYIEIFDRMTPAEFGRRNAERLTAAGTAKQISVGTFDAELIDMARRELRAPRLRVVHPSLMYRLFRQFWIGHRPLGFLEAHTRFERMRPPAGDLRIPGLPAEYVAVKFYAAQSLPDTPDNRRVVRRIVDALAEQYPVVLLDTGLAVDEHTDYALAGGARVISVREFMQPSDNLGVQTQIIAGARGFAGTCGSIAWLAPMLGVDTMAVMTDSRFLHTHLHAARWVYRALDAGAFAPLDLSAFTTFGLTVARTIAADSATPVTHRS